MKTSHRARLIIVGASLCLMAACESRPAPTAAPPPAPPPARPKITAGSAVCKLNPAQPGPMRRGGRARVQITGPGVAIDAKDVPALCGPLFNGDVPALDVKAGKGLLFETCLPEGTLQISSWERVSGEQSVHGTSQQGGTEVLFNKNAGATYTTRASAGDRIVLSEDMWKAEVSVALYDVVSEGSLRAQVTFECPTAIPLLD